MIKIMTVMNFSPPPISSVFRVSTILFIGFALILFSTTSNAEMYKYITKDGRTVLTGERLKGKGNRLVKIFRMKKSGAYKTSSRKKSRLKNTSKKRVKSNRKSSNKKYSRQRSKALKNMVKANGRDNGIIIGCNSSDHLSKQARIYQNPIKI